MSNSTDQTEWVRPYIDRLKTSICKLYRELLEIDTQQNSPESAEQIRADIQKTRQSIEIEVLKQRELRVDRMFRHLRFGDSRGGDFQYIFGRCEDLKYIDLSCADLSNARLVSAEFSFANFSGANLSCIKFSNCDLTGNDLSGANLSNATLTGCILNGANLRDANLRDANLKDSELICADFSTADVTNTQFWDCHRILSSLRQELIAKGAIFNETDFNETETV